MDDEQLKQAVANYQPNSQVLQAMRRIKILATVGTSASGKTTIMNKLTELSSDFKLVLDETSRQPRPNERPGVDFLFRKRDEIVVDLQAGALVQVAIGPNGDLYCTRPSSFPEVVSLMPLVPAAVMEFRDLPVAEFKAAFIVPADYNQWRLWLDKQAKESQWTPDQITARLAEAKKSYEYAAAHQELHFVLNDDITKAAQRLWQVSKGEIPDSEDVARQTATANYQKL